MNTEHGIWFPDEYQKHLKNQFCYADEDPLYGPRLFFENSGGSLRLRKAVEAKTAAEQFPDCPERNYARGLKLAHYVSEGTKEILEVIFGAKTGALVTELSASQTMFQVVELFLKM